MLQLCGLPVNSPLSVLVVEILPTITNIYEAISGLGDAAVNGALRQTIQMQGLSETGAVKAQMDQINRARDFGIEPDPLIEELEHHRILRTSPLTEVPFAC